MTTVKKQYQVHVDEVERVTTIWIDRMGLSFFEIENVFLDTLDPSDPLLVASCEVLWNYMTATIKWYLPKLVQRPIEEVEKFGVHELCHILLASEQSLIDTRLQERTSADNLSESEATVLQDLYYERLEHATELTARALLRAWS